MEDREPVICTRGLTRYFGSRSAVRGLDLEVPRGGVFALLGRNGSGKTTTIRMLLGLLEPTRGSATVLGADCQQLSPRTRGQIGCLAEGHPLYRWMQVWELGEFQSRFYSHWNGELFQGVLGHFRIEPGARCGNLSRGERAGLALAVTLAPESELLILDDPAMGLDPVARHGLEQTVEWWTLNVQYLPFFLRAEVVGWWSWAGVLASGALAAALTLFLLRASGLSVVERGVWVFGNLLLGLPGVLLLLSLEDWPHSEPRGGCGHKRIVTREECEHCSAPWPAPERDGAEILETCPG